MRAMPAGKPNRKPAAIVSSEASQDGTLWAVSFGTPNTSDPDGVTVVVDAATGEELSRFTSEQPAAAMAFDPAAGELVAAVFGGVHCGTATT